MDPPIDKAAAVFLKAIRADYSEKDASNLTELATGVYAYIAFSYKGMTYIRFKYGKRLAQIGIKDLTGDFECTNIKKLLGKQEIEHLGS
jgi:hypothetical protein